MKRVLYAVVVFALTCSIMRAADSNSSLPSTDRLPGVDLAEGISQTTGVAISPMLGVCSIGAWRYYHTPESKRYLLPWFCSPRVWGFGFFLLSLCFLKDLIGTAAPPLLKKPFDMAELLENKLSALVASAAFIPFVASQMARHIDTSETLRDGSGLQYACILPLELATSSVGAYLVILPLCLIAFLVVWITAHAINVLIALCPFGFIDAILKLAKMFLLSAVVLSYAINPYFGAAVSLLIICIAALLAPSAFRLMVFGTLLATDTIFHRRAREAAQPEHAHAFLAGKISNVPAHTFGNLLRSADGNLQFQYRPWLILTPRVIQLPSSGTIAISKGVFFPSLLHSQDGAAFTRILMFLPRYRGQESAIGAHLEISDIRDGTIMRGLAKVRAWLAETVNLGKQVS